MMNSTQIEIIKLLTANEIPDKDLAAIKQLIIQSLVDKIDASVDALFEQQQWDENKIAEWGNKHLRTSYK